MEFYYGFSRAKTAKDVLKIKHELTDRFGGLPVETKNLLFITDARILFKNTSVSKLSINGDGVVIVFDDIKPLPSLEKLFSAFDSFCHVEKVNHVFGKTRSGKLSVSFSIAGIIPSMRLLLKCSRLFLDVKNE